MVFTEKQLAQGVTTGAGINTIYTCPASTRAIIKNVVLVNTTAAVSGTTLAAFPAIGASSVNAITGMNVNPNTSHQMDCFIPRAEGEKFGFSSNVVGAITMTLFGAEITDPDMSFVEKVLVQAKNVGTGAESIYTPPAGTIAIIKNIFIHAGAHASPANILVSLFIDDDGTTYDASTAIMWEHEITYGRSEPISCYFPMNNSSGNFAIKVNKADSCSISLFGVEITI